jgi:hypothetical protein
MKLIFKDLQGAAGKQTVADEQKLQKRRKNHAEQQQAKKEMLEPKKQPVECSVLENENLKATSKKERKAILQQSILYGINVLPVSPMVSRVSNTKDLKSKPRMTESS